VAMLVAVPIGLMSAIYWSGRRRIQPADLKRNWSKLR